MGGEKSLQSMKSISNHTKPHGQTGKCCTPLGAISEKNDNQTSTRSSVQYDLHLAGYIRLFLAALSLPP
jgi:hypothetical protein